MIEAYRAVVFENYANFNGRAARPEYWWFTLANLIIVIGVFLLAFLLMAAIGEVGLLIGFGAIIIYGIAILIPGYAVTVRRLHDINKSAWWLLLGLIPWIGSIILLILMVLSTYPHPNKYGEPAGWNDLMGVQ